MIPENNSMVPNEIWEYNEFITFPKPSLYIRIMCYIVSISLLIFSFLWFFDIITIFFFNILFILFLLYGLSLVGSIGIRGTKKGIFPQNISINGGIVYVRYDDFTKAIFYGLKESYLLSECVWYRGYADWLVLNHWGISFLPCCVSKVIVIYHIPTHNWIICGITNDNYLRLSDILHKKNIYQCRQRSRFEPFVILFFSCLGFIFVFEYCSLWGFSDYWIMCLLFTIPPLCAGLGSILCGNDFFYVQIRYMIRVLTRKL